MENPSQIGDPVSLKAKTSSTQPTDKDKPKKDAKNEFDNKESGQKSLKEMAKENPSMIGDPVSAFS